MNIAKEELEISFKIKKKMPNYVLRELQLDLINETFVGGKVSKKEQISEYIKGVSPYFPKNDPFSVMLLKTYDIKMNDEDSAHDFFNSLFLPQFEVTECELSNINFYLDMDDEIYAVDINYDFENKITIKVGTFINQNNDYNKIFKDFNIILSNILGEECDNASSR